MTGIATLGEWMDEGSVEAKLLHGKRIAERDVVRWAMQLSAGLAAPEDYLKKANVARARL